jgi:hypothetical protein
MLRISLVTLGVRDVGQAAVFYERLGLIRSSAGNDSVAFFQLGPAVLGLFGREALAEDAQAGPLWTGNGGVTLAYNVASPEQVDRAMARAEAAGATVLKPAQQAFWGGYHGYIADPDGHVWEIAHNPFFPLTEDGAIVLPPPVTDGVGDDELAR